MIGLHMTELNPGYLASNFGFHQLVLDYEMKDKQHLVSNLQAKLDIFVLMLLFVLQRLHGSDGKSKYKTNMQVLWKQALMSRSTVTW